MEHRPIHELATLADLTPHPPAMSRRQRLERWAELLEADPERRLRTLGEIEFLTPQQRDEARAPNSALALAFADETLRREGLASDRLGDATRFFELSPADAHRTLCSCMNGHQVASGVTAKRVRRIADPRLLDRVLPYVPVAVLIGAPAVLLLAA